MRYKVACTFGEGEGGIFFAGVVSDFDQIKDLDAI